MRHAVAAILASALALGAAPRFARAAAIDRVTLSERGNVVELSFEFQGTAPRFKLGAAGNELTIDLDRARVGVPPRPLFGREKPPVVAVRTVELGKERARITIEVAGKTDYAIARIGSRIILRVATAGAAPNIAQPLLVRAEDRGPPDGANRRESITVPATRARTREAQIVPPGDTVVAYRPPTDLSQPLVIIDPGHGGDDPGTIAASGLAEKDVALQIARRLRDELRARGVRAELTRDSDVFITLSNRTLIANRARADLFVSIHLNSSPNLETTGIETYYLNNTTDRATIRLARLENQNGGASYGAPEEANLNYILSDLRQQYKAGEAAALARMIDAQTAAELNAGLGLSVNALGAKMGPFWVLVGAHMPAVLAECGFLSNRGEALRLASPAYQAAVARGIANAVTHYFNKDAAVGNL
ncbi:MAG: N-acetylmuramoyl-L-alanine amidase family protein [Candidatus Binataceae bacterium]